MTKEERIAVFQNTTKIVQKGRYISPNGTEININNEDMMKRTKVYTENPKIDFDSLTPFNTNVKVINQDCLLVAKELENPVVLNMASFIRPGGGVEKGSAAQEENVFRRTNLFMALYQFDKIGEKYNIKTIKQNYPLKRNLTSLYTPNVTVFRDTENNNYEYLEKTYQISVITLPAIKEPKLNNDGKLKPSYAEAYEEKIKQILSIAIDNKHTNIVLSAFGCGAYKTPPTEIAQLFKKILRSDQFRGKFKNVVFAIIDDKNAYQKHNPNGNLKPFLNVFNNN